MWRNFLLEGINLLQACAISTTYILYAYIYIYIYIYIYTYIHININSDIHFTHVFIVCAYIFVEIGLFHSI